MKAGVSTVKKTTPRIERVIEILAEIARAGSQRDIRKINKTGDFRSHSAPDLH